MTACLGGHFRKWSHGWRMRAQIRDLNSGTFGFVELALDKTTGQQVAIKFIERGDKARRKGPFARAPPPRSPPTPTQLHLSNPMPAIRVGGSFRCMLGSLTLFWSSVGHEVCGEGNSEPPVSHAPAHRAV